MSTDDTVEIRSAPARKARVKQSGADTWRAAMADTTALLHAIVKNTPIIVWALDRQGVIRFCEGRGLEALGFRPDELIGRSVEEVWSDSPEVVRSAGEILSGKSTRSVTRFGDIHLETLHFPLRGPGAEIVGVAGVALNVTDRQRVEEELAAERDLLEQTLSSHERDRKLIAFEIHDGLVQDATAAQLHLEALLLSEEVPEGKVRREIELSLELVRGSVNQARRLIAGLRPPILDELGLQAAIEYMVESQPNGGPAIEFAADVRFERLESLVEGTVFRIAQEAITNIRRHSKAERASIRLTEIDDRLQLEVRDWGVGFDPASVTRHRHGLQGVRERALLLHGRVSIDSKPGKGTRIFVDLPVSASPKEAALFNDRSIE